MSALVDRRRWLDHLDDCTLCPVSLCDRGLELAAAVRESMAPGEFWQGAYRPRRREGDEAVSDADRRRAAQDEAAERA